MFLPTIEMFVPDWWKAVIRVVHARDVEYEKEIARLRAELEKRQERG